MRLALTRTQARTRVRKNDSYLLFSGSGRREESFFGRPQKLDSLRISLEDSGEERILSEDLKEERISLEDQGEESDTRRLVSSRVSPGIAPLPEDRKRRLQQLYTLELLYRVDRVSGYLPSKELLILRS